VRGIDPRITLVLSRNVYHSGKHTLNEETHKIRNLIQKTAAQGNLIESSSVEVLVGNAHVSTWICTSQNEDVYVTPRHFHHFHSPPPHFHLTFTHFHLTSALSHRTMICMPGGVCHPNGAPHEDTCICSACRLFKITNDLDCRLRELAIKLCSHRTYQLANRYFAEASNTSSSSDTPAAVSAVQIQSTSALSQPAAVQLLRQATLSECYRPSPHQSQQSYQSVQQPPDQPLRQTTLFQYNFKRISPQ
jgi:hypothetical protein